MSAEIKILNSTHSLTGIGRLGGLESVTFPLDTYLQVANNAGLDGIELTPTRRMSAQIVSGNLDLHQLAQIEVVAQSFRSERGVAGLAGAIIRNPDRTMFSVGSFLQYAPISDVRALEKIQELKDVPVVIQDVQRLQSGLRNQVMIVQPETFAYLEVSKVEDIPEAAGHRHLNLCLDPYQLRRRNAFGETTPLGELDKSVPLLWPSMKVLHLSLGRTDLQGNSGSVNDLNDVIRGDHHSKVGQDLALIGSLYKRSENKPPIVIQLMKSGVSQVIEKSQMFLGDLEGVLAKVKTNIAEMMELL